jgi:hypothetical protein
MNMKGNIAPERVRIKIRAIASALYDVMPIIITYIVEGRRLMKNNTGMARAFVI